MSEFREGDLVEAVKGETVMRARGCFGSVPESPKSPELAETGFEGVEWWHVIVGGVLLAVGMGAILVGERGENREGRDE